MITKELVKWFRDARTMTRHRSYKHFTHTFRMWTQSLYGNCTDLVWVLCPIFRTAVPDSGLTPLGAADRLAWAFGSPALALRRSVVYSGWRVVAGGGVGPLTGVRLSGGVRLASRALRAALDSFRPWVPRSLVAWKKGGVTGSLRAAAVALTRLTGAWPPVGRRSLAGGSVRDEASDARRRLDVPVFAQQAEGRPNRIDADPRGVGDVLLAGEPVARAEPAVLDRIHDEPGELPVQRHDSPTGSEVSPSDAHRL